MELRVWLMYLMSTLCRALVPTKQFLRKVYTGWFAIAWIEGHIKGVVLEGWAHLGDLQMGLTPLNAVKGHWLSWAHNLLKWDFSTFTIWIRGDRHHRRGGNNFSEGNEEGDTVGAEGVMDQAFRSVTGLGNNACVFSSIIRGGGLFNGEEEENVECSCKYPPCVILRGFYRNFTGEMRMVKHFKMYLKAFEGRCASFNIDLIWRYREKEGIKNEVQKIQAKWRTDITFVFLKEESKVYYYYLKWGGGLRWSFLHIFWNNQTWWCNGWHVHSKSGRSVVQTLAVIPKTNQRFGVKAHLFIHLSFLKD